MCVRVRGSERVSVSASVGRRVVNAICVRGGEQRWHSVSATESGDSVRARSV
jgi:hypothetical protein